MDSVFPMTLGWRQASVKDGSSAVIGRREEMKAYVVFSSRGPLLVVTRGTIRNRQNLKRLGEIGCSKFIARELPVEQVRKRYGAPFECVEAGLDHGAPLRVLDHDGERVFAAFSFEELGHPVKYEERSPKAQC